MKLPLGGGITRGPLTSAPLYNTAQTFSVSTYCLHPEISSPACPGLQRARPSLHSAGMLEIRLQSYQRLAATVAQLISRSFKQCDCQRQALPSPSAKLGVRVANDPQQHSSLSSAVLQPDAECRNVRENASDCLKQVKHYRGASSLHPGAELWL